MGKPLKLLNAYSAPLVVKLADCADEITQAQQLRYKAFVLEEKNLNLYNETMVEKDEYDEYCEHVIVKDQNSNQVVGTYRLLPGDRAKQTIGFYSETEFDLGPFADYKPFALELGRSCVAADYRDGRVIQLLWEGIAGYILSHNYHYLIGCASMHMNSLEQLKEIYTMLKVKHILTDRFGVRPLETHRIQQLETIEYAINHKEIYRKLPPLMKGYQCLGAEIAGDPAYDSIFKTVDFFIVLETHRITKKYRRRFFNR